MINILNKFRQREDVQAVMGVIHDRAHTPYPDRMSMRMNNEAGKTWIGAILWNSLTLVQDFPNTVVTFIVVFIIGTMAIIGQAILH